jgi:hypothetical protein
MAKRVLFTAVKIAAPAGIWGKPSCWLSRAKTLPLYRLLRDYWKS